MHNNFYFLRQLSQKLNLILRGYSVVSCFTQSRDELVLEFNNSKNSIFLRADLSPRACCLSFPENFKRAKKNSTDLFPEIIFKNVMAVRQYENERSFSIQLEDTFGLLFKMHGNHSNVVLLEGDTVIAIFRNNLVADLDTQPEKLDRRIDWGRPYFDAHLADLPGAYFTFGKDVWSYLNKKGFQSADADIRWSLFQAVLHELENPAFIITRTDGKIKLMLLPVEPTVKKLPDPITAITEFYQLATVTEAFSHEKSAALKKLYARKDNGTAYISKNKEKLAMLRDDVHYTAWADLIMANLGNIRPGMDKITVEDLYHDNAPIEIKLKANLNPQKNAEVYYRKGKNQQIEIRKLQESIGVKGKELALIDNEIRQIETCEDLRELRAAIGASSVITSVDEKSEVSLPYREFEFKGYRIWVGRNAAANDELTLRHGYKEDLWLHAKGVAGSHVLLKYQAGKNFPSDVIEHAASLAAYYSKRKGERLCPVAYTPKKFVRKRKGDPAGAVVVEREKVLLVEPAGEKPTV